MKTQSNYNILNKPIRIRFGSIKFTFIYIFSYFTALERSLNSPRVNVNLMQQRYFSAKIAYMVCKLTIIMQNNVIHSIYYLSLAPFHVSFQWQRLNYSGRKMIYCCVSSLRFKINIVQTIYIVKHEIQRMFCNYNSAKFIPF